MSKMASHEPIGHLQHKLWLKEGPGAKLAVWFPTTKSWESTSIPVCAGRVRHTIGKLSRRATSFLQTLSQSVVGTRSYERPKSWESKLGQFRDSTLGVSGKSAIWMQVRRRGTKNIIWGKVVASPESGLCWVKWVQGYPWFVPTPRVFRMRINQLIGWFWM
jgi:hypothetical protein